MKKSYFLVIISLISFLSVILITGSPFKSYTNSFDHNNPILIEIPSIQAQDDGGNDGGDNDFAGFEEEDDVNNQNENEEDTNQFSFESEESEDNDAKKQKIKMMTSLVLKQKTKIKNQSKKISKINRRK